MAELARLFAGLAHDLRTPLTIIRNAVYFLRRSTQKTSETTEALDLIEGQSKELDQVLTELIEVSSISVPKPVEVDLETFLTEISERLDANRQTTWRFELEFRPAHLWVDRGQFKRVLQNLFQNSMTAMKGKGEVHIRAWREPEFDWVEIRDSGPGVSNEIKADLFEPLVSTKPAGMGLGLAFCREVINRHGGAISLVEGVPPGATIRFSLPRRPVA